ncbi:hypothetical protein VTO73DRAFT_15115 [Trametes versicolor]
MGLLAHGGHVEVKEHSRDAMFQNLADGKAGSYPLATKPGQESLIPAGRGCWTHAVAHASVGRSLGSGHKSSTAEAVDERIETNAGRRSARRAHPWKCYSESALGHVETARTEMPIAGSGSEQ